MALTIPMMHRGRSFALVFENNTPDPQEHEAFSVTGELSLLAVQAIVYLAGQATEYGLCSDMKACDSSTLLATLSAGGVIFEWPESMIDQPGEIPVPEEIN